MANGSIHSRVCNAQEKGARDAYLALPRTGHRSGAALLLGHLLAGEAHNVSAIARRFGVSRPTVRNWRAELQAGDWLDAEHRPTDKARTVRVDLLPRALLQHASRMTPRQLAAAAKLLADSRGPQGAYVPTDRQRSGDCGASVRTLRRARRALVDLGLAERRWKPCGTWQVVRMAPTAALGCRQRPGEDLQRATQQAADRGQLAKRGVARTGPGMRAPAETVPSLPRTTTAAPEPAPARMVQEPAQQRMAAPAQADDNRTASAVLRDQARLARVERDLAHLQDANAAARDSRMPPARVAEDLLAAAGAWTLPDAGRTLRHRGAEARAEAGATIARLGLLPDLQRELEALAAWQPGRVQSTVGAIVVRAILPRLLTPHGSRARANCPPSPTLNRSADALRGRALDALARSWRGEPRTAFRVAWQRLRTEPTGDPITVAELAGHLSTTGRPVTAAELQAVLDDPLRAPATAPLSPAAAEFAARVRRVLGDTEHPAPLDSAAAKRTA